MLKPKMETLTRRFSKISRIVEIVFSIPALSATVERCFSNAGQIYCPERCQLSDTKFEQSMFISLIKIMK